MTDDEKLTAVLRHVKFVCERRFPGVPIVFSAMCGEKVGAGTNALPDDFRTMVAALFEKAKNA